MSDAAEQGIFLIIGIVFCILLVQIIGQVQKKKYLQASRLRLSSQFGQVPQKEMSSERYEKVPAFFLRHRPEEEIDDITWNDLEMDRLYRRMDSTQSAAGEEYLYALLRSPGTGDPEKDDLLIPYDTIRYLEAKENEDVRIRLQLSLQHFGHAGKYSLCDYLDFLNEVPKENPLVHLPAFLLPVISIVILLNNVQTGILCLFGSLALNTITYYKRRGKIDPYLSSFSYLLRMIRCTDEVTAIHCPVLREETKKLNSLKPFFSRFRRGSGVVLSGSAVSGGNPLDLLMDYFRILFHLDLIRFDTMLSQVLQYKKEMELALAILGRIDTAIALASFEKSLPYTCVPQFSDGSFPESAADPGDPEEQLHSAEKGRNHRKQKGHGKNAFFADALYHPLLEHPVPNSIRADRPILLTGSNASGKSTFLKSAAICAIFAQTIGFCPAQSYQGEHYRIRSSMALRDSIQSGESYFMVEIRSLKRIADLSQDHGRRVLCFVDEVLRGTNTIERIAASTEILKTLADQGVLCFAATHDIELTQLLSEEYDNYHFEEEVRDGDVVFSYELHPGRATTRNAIRLLESVGFDREVTERARKRAEMFEQTGQWEKTVSSPAEAENETNGKDQTESQEKS